MRIGGKEVKGPNEEVLVLPRLDDEIIIRAKAVTDMSDFDVLVPEPKAPGRRTRDGYKPNLDDEGYKQRLEHYNNQRFAFLILKSLEPSEIEWEKVNLDDPSTWLSWDDELREAGLSDVEVQRIIVCVMQANALDENKLRAAREVFLLGLGQEPEKSFGPDIEQPNMQSGEPVND